MRSNFKKAHARHKRGRILRERKNDAFLKFFLKHYPEMIVRASDEARDAIEKFMKSMAVFGNAVSETVKRARESQSKCSTITVGHVDRHEFTGAPWYYHDPIATEEAILNGNLPPTGILAGTEGLVCLTKDDLESDTSPGETGSLRECSPNSSAESSPVPKRSRRKSSTDKPAK